MAVHLLLEKTFARVGVFIEAGCIVGCEEAVEVKWFGLDNLWCWEVGWGLGRSVGFADLGPGEFLEVRFHFQNGSVERLVFEGCVID